MSYVRAAHHAGSWYRGSRAGLDADVSDYLKKATQPEKTHPLVSETEGPRKKLKCLISPHAGLTYSAQVSTKSY